MGHSQLLLLLPLGSYQPSLLPDTERESFASIHTVNYNKCKRRVLEIFNMEKKAGRLEFFLTVIQIQCIYVPPSPNDPANATAALFLHGNYHVGHAIRGVKRKARA